MQDIFIETIQTKRFFLNDVAYGDFKDSIRTTVSDKTIRHKALNITKNPKYDEY